MVMKSNYISKWRIVFITELIYFITAKYKFRLNLNIQNMHNIERTSNKIIYVLILAHHKLGSI